MRPTAFATALLLLIVLSGPARAQEPPQSTADQAVALSAAARRGDAAAVEALLDAGVDVNTKFRYEVTALSYAADRGHVDVVKLLLERGADPNTTDTFYNASPLTWAASPAGERTPRHAEVVRLLLEHGATGADGALLPAIRAGDGPMVKVILDHDRLSEETLTRALEMATRADAAAMVSMLEAAGAKPAPVVTLSAEQLARYPGTYRAERGGTAVVVTLREGQLVVDASQIGGPAELPLTPRSDTRFAADGVGVEITFELDEERAAALTVGGTRYARTRGDR